MSPGFYEATTGTAKWVEPDTVVDRARRAGYLLVVAQALGGDLAELTWLKVYCIKQPPPALDWELMSWAHWTRADATTAAPALPNTWAVEKFDEAWAAAQSAWRSVKSAAGGFGSGAVILLLLVLAFKRK